jgi:2-polyprenyl-6-methoxyphenol hydroxylase-like FAD-dependent oxidoreductase
VKIAIIGGGPSGLYLGLLLKRQQPDWQIDVIEQNQANDTFGFGVVLADTGLAQLQEADEASHAALCAAMHYNDRQNIVHKEKPISYQLHVRGGAIARLALLKILGSEAEKAGVRILYGKRLETVDGLAELNLEAANVVVGADGVNSVVRRQFAGQFGTTQYNLTNHFAWYGTKKIFDCPALVFRKHRGGHFVAHYYSYSDGMSTFVAECDDATWQTLGLGSLSDDQRRKLFEEIYAPELGAYPLLSNNSLWRQFPVIRNKHWSYGRHVLIGDALASAHFSIGSGTRIAMGDSIALARALLASDDDVLAGLADFEAKHRDQKAKLVDASEQSFKWYERIADWMEQYGPEEFVYRFMIRTGRVDDARLRAEFPQLMSRLEPQLRAG